MKVQLRAIIDSEEQLARLFSGRARAKEAFSLALIRRKVAPIVEEFRARRLELFKEHGYRDRTQVNVWNFWREAGEDGKREIDLDAFERFDEELQELLDADVSIDFEVDIATIDKAKVEPALTPDELAALWWLIKEFREEEG